MTADAGKRDEDIVKGVQKGNTDLFGLLVERYEGKLLRYGRTFVSDADDIKDVVQNIFIKAYTNIMSFDAERKFSPWIYRIAHNEFVDEIRRRSKTETVSVFDFDTLFPHLVEGESAESEMQKKELKKNLDECLSRLDVKYREPLILYYYESLDYREIADILKVPVSTVGVRLKRGKDKLEKAAREIKLAYE